MNKIFWNNMEQEVVDVIRNKSISTVAMEENEFFSTANPPKTGMFTVSPSVGGAHLPSRDTFAFVSIYNPAIIEYDNNGTIEQYKVRIIHAMRMTNLDTDVRGMEWYGYTLYTPNDTGWDSPDEASIEDYTKLGYTSGWVGIDVNVVDNLISDSDKDALSAKQGKIIKDYYDTQSAELAKVATDTVLGRVKIDGRTIITNADGAIESVEPKYTSTDYGVIVENPFSLELTSGETFDWTLFQMYVGNTEMSNRIIEIDLSIIPLGEGADTAHRIDMNISFERTESGGFINGRYVTNNCQFEKDELGVHIYNDSGRYYLTIDIRKPHTKLTTGTILVLANKIVVRGTGDLFGNYEDVEDFVGDIVDSNTVQGTKSITFVNDSPHPSSSLDMIYYPMGLDILSPDNIKSGIYRADIYGKIGIEDGQYIISLSSRIDEVDGSVFRFWVAHQIEIDYVNNRILTRKMYHMTDMIYNGQIGLNGVWHRIDTDIDTIQNDIQTLFTGWANETKRAATALSQKGVATSQDASMKTIVDNISLIPSGKRIYHTNATSGSITESFDYVGSGTIDLHPVDIDLSVIGFKAGTIIIEDINTIGTNTVVRVYDDSMLSAQVISVPNSNTGTCQWIRLGSSGMPISTIKIPVADNASYNVTIIEE